MKTERQGKKGEAAGQERHFCFPLLKHCFNSVLQHSYHLLQTEAEITQKELSN